MAFEEEKEYDRLIGKARKACRASYLFFCALYRFIFIAWIILFCACFFLLLFPGTVSGFSFISPLVLLKVFLFGVLAVALLRSVQLIFKDMSTGLTPFTKKQSKRMKFISFLIFFQVVFEMVFVSSLSPIFINEDLSINYQVSNAVEPSIFINVEALIFAIVFYCLSLAFEYGALLQKDKDDYI